MCFGFQDVKQLKGRSERKQFIRGALTTDAHIWRTKLSPQVYGCSTFSHGQRE